MKYISTEGHTWYFHTSLRAQSYRLLWPLQQSWGKGRRREAQLEHLCQYSWQRLTVVRINQEPSVNLSPSKESQAGTVFPAQPGRALCLFRNFDYSSSLKPTFSFDIANANGFKKSTTTKRFGSFIFCSVLTFYLFICKKKKTGNFFPI